MDDLNRSWMNGNNVLDLEVSCSNIEPLQPKPKLSACVVNVPSSPEEYIQQTQKLFAKIV